MNETVFISLFKEVCEKCFGTPLTHPLTETDSKILANRIFEKTGLVIGPKSIKNYSLFVLGQKDYRKENPSDATLDTLARYVLDAPYTDEIQRKRNENHYPYWFRYRSKFSPSGAVSRVRNPKKAGKRPFLLVSFLALLIFIPVTLFLVRKSKKDSFTDNFNSISEKSLVDNGWFIKWKDEVWWNKINEKPGHMALFTLRGDNWKNAENIPRIRNLIVRRIQSECFAVEIHMTGFIPFKNWQQAGILLSEDSTFTGKMIRLSIAYNDFFGGYEKPPEIIIQAVSSAESGNQSKPEEISHFALFTIDTNRIDLVEKNLETCSLKIEKSGKKFRFLYTAGPMESFAFKEVISKEIPIHPRFIGLFAIQGWTDDINTIPAYFDSYTFSSIPCVK